ncbi:MAG TPA: putative porin [Candidatus Omnitrophota bacterium]|nr:putative porin [Candidatus Omnitrophota bacterium]HPS20884.1 putative porin [Candidatus Omnitrophota bacterium]
MLKKIFSVVLAAVFLCSATPVWAGEVDLLISKLVEKGILSPNEAQLLKAEIKEESAKEMAKGEATTAPDWTQRIAVKGDVRVREQIDWGKSTNSSSYTAVNNSPISPAHQEMRTRVRGRIGIEGKVNDQIKAGARLVSGSSSDPRSTNQTLTDNFEKYSAWFDQYYITWQPKLNKEWGDAKIIGGKFANPFFVSEMFWDSDICPGGIAMQYTSPVLDGIDFATTNLFSNLGLLWLDELPRDQSDTMMWVGQGGIEMAFDNEMASNLKTGVGIFAENCIKDKLDTANVADNSAYTNTRWMSSDGGGLVGAYRYDYRMVDWMTTFDNANLFGMVDIGNGIYSDFVCNSSATQKNIACQFGGYLGKKEVKEQKDWKVWAEYRYIERDAILDLLPDSDFPGFNLVGATGMGGTNTQGVCTGIQYALWKNTVLYLKYATGVPLSSVRTEDGYKKPYQLFQADVVVKF